MADNKLRTREELLLPEYNYYVFFKIEPTEKDVAKIEKLIQAENNKWTQGLPIQRRYKELLPDVKKVLLEDKAFDPKTGDYTITNARAKELDNAKKLKLGDAAKLIISMANNKGRLYKSELNTIVSSEKIKWFTIADLENIVNDLTKQGVKYIDDTQSVIDFSNYKKIESYLTTASTNSLYDLLGLTNTSSIADFAAAIKATNAKNAPQKTTPKGTAVDKLLGLAQIVFKTEDSKKKYDDYLAIKKEVWDDLEMRQSHGIKEITLDEFLGYAEKIKAFLKMPIDQVEVYLAAGLKQFKLIVVGGDGATDIDLEICPYPECGRAYRVYKGKSEKTCPHCGKPLEILCWNCANTMPYTTKSKVCPTCGGTAQSKTLFDARVEDVDKILRMPTCNIIDLRSALANLKNVLPKYNSVPNSLIAKKVNEYEGEINKKIKEEETTGVNYKKDVADIQKEMAAKNYMRASSLAASLKTKYPTYNTSNTDGLIGDINKILDSAKMLVQQAKTYMAHNNESQVIDCASKALAICADYHEARQILPPPAAPANVRLTLTKNNSVRVDWTITGSQNLTSFSVIRKVGSKPVNSNDGECLEKGLTINFFEDAHIVSGTPYYYAVFAERCGKPSAVIPCPTPAQVFMDVEDVQQELVMGVIKVKWNAPHNLKSVEVWRKEGPVAPSTPGDGTRLTNATLEGFTDNTSANQCGYLILAEYDMGGTKKQSLGIRCVFKKYQQLQKLDDSKIIPLASGEFMLDAKTTGDQKLSIVYCKERVSCRLDTVLPLNNFNVLCKNASIANVNYDMQQNMLFKLPPNLICWAYPMVSNDQLFALSAPVLVSTIAGIKNVSFNNMNGSLKLTGIVDPGIKNVIIKVSHNKFPLDINDEGDKFTVSRDRFEVENGAIIKLQEETMNYISVFTEIEQNGKIAYTRAIPISDEPIGALRRKTVQYAMDYTVSSSKKFPITIKFSSDEEAVLPRLCIVKGFPSPMDKSQGQLVEKIEPITLTKGFFSKTYTAKCTVMVQPDARNVKFKLFVDDDTVKHIQLKQVINLK